MDVFRRARQEYLIAYVPERDEERHVGSVDFGIAFEQTNDRLFKRLVSWDERFMQDVRIAAVDCTGRYVSLKKPLSKFFEIHKLIIAEESECGFA